MTTAIQKNIADNVLARVQALNSDKKLSFPANYSPENALKSAWLILQNTVDRQKKPVLQTCTTASIANTLFDMVIQGLSPAKKQCYFIAYSNQLTLMRSYMGTIAVTKRIEGIEDVFAQVIYKGDDFEYKINPVNGTKEVTKHVQKFENVKNENIIGAYAVVMRDGKPNYTEIMTFDEIVQAWKQGSGYGRSSTHTDFAQEMAKKTVINRACKIFFNTGDDADLLMEAINRTTENEYTQPEDVEAQVIGEIAEEANTEEIGFDEPEPEKEPEPESEPEKEPEPESEPEKEPAAKRAESQPDQGELAF